MRIEKRVVGKLSLRSIFTAMLMIGAFMVVHGFLMRLISGGHLIELIAGIIISALSIVIAAFPSKVSDVS